MYKNYVYDSFLMKLRIMFNVNFMQRMIFNYNLFEIINTNSGPRVNER